MWVFVGYGWLCVCVGVSVGRCHWFRGTGVGGCGGCDSCGYGQL